MPSEDYRRGKLLPDPVTPPDTVCFMIQIPNAVQYRAAFLGQINVLGVASTWDHPTNGTECLDCEQAAQLWRNAIYNATWSDECGGDMSCADVADCIENDEAVQAALIAQLGSAGAGNVIYETTVVGQPMSITTRNGTVANGGPSCDLDILFGSVTAIVDQLNQNNTDFLEVILLSDNNQQRVSKVIKAIPLLNEVPIDEVLDFVSELTTEIKENYDAQYTSALRDTYRCDLFCIAQDDPDCELTFQNLVEYFNNRIGTSLEPVNFFGSLVTYFIAGTWSGTSVVDILSLIQLSAWQQASDFSGISLRTLQTVGALGANDPDHDWELICDDCVSEECDDIKAGMNDWVFLDPVYGTYYPGEGAGRGTETSRIGMMKQFTGMTVTQFRVIVNEDITGLTTGVFPGYNSFGSETFGVATGTSFLFYGNWTNGVAWEVIGTGALPPTLRVVQICYKAKPS